MPSKAVAWKQGWYNYDRDWGGTLFMGRLAIGLTLKDWRWRKFRPQVRVIYWSNKRLDQFADDLSEAFDRAIQKKIDERPSA